MKRTETMVKITSFDDNDDEEDNRHSIGSEVVMQQETLEVVEEDDVITQLRKKLPADARPVFDIMLEDTRPEDYIEKYGPTSPKISHMAEYLNLSPKEIKRLKNIIKVHCLALGVGR
jgi:hypothetical protein